MSPMNEKRTLVKWRDTHKDMTILLIHTHTHTQTLGQLLLHDFSHALIVPAEDASIQLLYAQCVRVYCMNDVSKKLSFSRRAALSLAYNLMSIHPKPLCNQLVSFTFQFHISTLFVVGCPGTEEQGEPPCLAPFLHSDVCAFVRLRWLKEDREQLC